MVFKVQDKLLGYYTPSFFCANICTDEELINLDELSIGTQSTLIHEYVHFMQDILTTFGLINICNTVNNQKAINSIINSSNNGCFQRPIDIETKHPEVEQNILAFDTYMGSFDSDFDENSIINKYQYENGYVKDYESRIPYVRIDYSNTNGKTDSFMFGAIHFMENMAYLVEQSMFDNVKVSSYPYRIVEETCRFIYPELATDDNVIIILCDIALGTYHPAKFFIETVEKMRCDNFIPNDLVDIYHFVEAIKFKDPNGNAFSYDGLFDVTSKRAEEELQSMFTVEDVFAHVRNYFKELISISRKIKVENPYFWITILKQNTKASRRQVLIREIVNKLGYPLLRNNGGLYSTSTPLYSFQGNEWQLLSISAIEHIYEYVRNINYSNICPLIKNCELTISHEIDINTNNFCFHPWNIFIAPNSKLCNVGMMMRMWGIYHNKPYVKK